MALELSTKDWLLTMSVALDARRCRAGVRADEAAAVQRVLAVAKARCGLRAEAVVGSCYEAARDGFIRIGSSRSWGW